jgi:transposase
MGVSKIIKRNEQTCPNCGGNLKRYDKVKRIVRLKARAVRNIELPRKKCINCGKVHREITDEILPYKHYEPAIVKAVLEGIITSDTLGYEDYPCEKTMIKWRSQKLQFLL